MKERYQLTRGVGLALAASLLSITVGMMWHTPAPFAVIAVVLAGLTVTMPGGCVIDVAWRGLSSGSC